MIDFTTEELQLLLQAMGRVDPTNMFGITLGIKEKLAKELQERDAKVAEEPSSG